MAIFQKGRTKMANELKANNQSNVPDKIQAKMNNNENGEQQQNKYWFRFRLIPIWLRIVIVLLLWILAIIIGLMIGFGVLGDGKATDVLKWDTWQHILNIMNGKQ